MSKQGYIKLYRQIQDSTIWDDPYKLKLWLYCLLKASHTDTQIMIDNQVVKLKKGQFITGRVSLENDFNKGITPKKRISGLTLFRWLKVFENVQMLNIKKSNKYSIITVLNWDMYQNFEQQMNNSCTTDEQQMNTNKNSKNSKNINKEDKSFKIPSLEDISSYCKEINSTIDPQAFYDFYTSNGWKVGKNPMKNWKASVRNWESRTQQKDNSKKAVTVYEKYPLL